MHWMDRFEQWGRMGALPAFGLTALCLGASVLLWTLPDHSLYFGSRIQIVAVMTAVWAPLFALLGARALRRPRYDAAEAFPSLSDEAFLHTLLRAERPVCVCTACRISVPARFSTGDCPRCSSGVDYYEIFNDDDATLVLTAIA